MTRKPKADDPPPVYEVDELPVERRLFTRERRAQSGPFVTERDGEKVVVERRKSPGRRKTDRDPGPGKT
jgi:hypothetical protein